MTWIYQHLSDGENEEGEEVPDVPSLILGTLQAKYGAYGRHNSSWERASEGFLAA